jgi:hypothetical protein
MQQRVEPVRTPDGLFDLTVWVPDGGSDPYITRDQVKAVEDASAGRPNVVIYVEEEAGARLP